MNEEEVIERLNRYKTIKVLYGNTFAMHLEQLEQLKNDIDTVLNLLETQKAEIEKKDKIINEMAEYISKTDSTMFYNKLNVIQEFEYVVEGRR